MAGQTVSIRVDADARRAISELRRTGTAVSGLERQSTLAGGRIGHAFGTVARAGMLAAGGGAVALGVGLYKSLTAAGDFQKQINILGAVSGASGKQLNALRAEAIGLGKDAKLPATSAQDAAEALTELAKGGLSVKDSMAAARPVLQLSAAAQVDNATAANFAATALNAFHLQGTQAAHVADLLAGAANASAGDIGDFSEGLQFAGSAAHAAGQSIDLTVAALAEMANAGLSGSVAGSALANALRALQAPTAKAQGVLDKFGLSIYDAQGNMKPLDEIAQVFTKHLGGLSQEQQNAALATVFGSRAVQAARIVFLGGAKQLDNYRDKVAKTGNAQRLAEAQTKGFSGALGAFQSNIETLGIQLGTKLLPVATRVVRGLSGIVDEIGKITNAPSINIAAKILWTDVRQAAHSLFDALHKEIDGETSRGKPIKLPSGKIIGWEFTQPRPGLKDMIRKEINQIDWGGLAGDLHDGLDHATVGLTSGVQDWGRSLHPQLIAFRDGITSSLRDHWGDLGKIVFRKPGQSITGEFKDFFAGIGGLVNDHAPKIVGAFLDRFGKLVPGTHGILHTVNLATNKSLGDIFSDIKQRVGRIGDFFTKWWGDEKEQVKRVLGDIKDRIAHAWGDVRNKTSEVWTKIRGRLGEDWQAIKKLVKKALGDVKDAMAHAWGDVRDKVRDAWGSIVESLSNKFGDIRKKVSNLKDDVVHAFAKAWDSIKTGVAKGWDKIVGTLKTWVGKFVGPVNKVLGFLHVPQIPGFASGGVATGGPHGVNASGGVAQFAQGGVVAPRKRNDQGIYKAVPGGVYKLAEAGSDEAVISLDKRHRDRSIAILSETMRRLDIVPQFAAGGIASAGGLAAASKEIRGLVDYVLGGRKYETAAKNLRRLRHHQRPFEDEFAVWRHGHRFAVPIDAWRKLVGLAPGVMEDEVKVRKDHHLFATAIDNLRRLRADSRIFEDETTVRYGGQPFIVPRDDLRRIPGFSIGGIIKKHAKGIGSAVGGAASSVTGAIGDIAGGLKDFFTDPKKWLLSHLPKPPELAGPIGKMATAAMKKIFDEAVKFVMGKSGGRGLAGALAEARRISALHLPYVWGGGHVSNPLAYPEGTGGGFDCSGYVSRVLEVAGLMRGPAIRSDGFNTRGKPGLGPVSTLSNYDHVYMMLGGQAYGTSSYNPGGGAGGPLPYGVRSGFTVRHYDRGGVVPGQGAQLAMVHGGETILPTHKRRGVVHFAPTINVYPQPGQDERTIAALIDRRLRRFNAVFS